MLTVVDDLAFSNTGNTMELILAPNVVENRGAEFSRYARQLCDFVMNEG